MSETSTIKMNWDEVGISNDFLFGRIMRNPELCKELLQRILPELEMDHVEYPELQKGIEKGKIYDNPIRQGIQSFCLLLF